MMDKVEPSTTIDGEQLVSSISQLAKISSTSILVPNYSTNLASTAPKNEKLGYIKPDKLEVPDGGYGWVVVFAVFLFYFTSWGSNAGFGIYLATYLENGTFASMGKFDYALIGGLNLGVGLAISPLINYLVGLIGIRRVLILGALIEFATTLMASFAVNKWQLYLTQGVFSSVGLGLVAIPGLALLPQWFRKKRALVQGIATGGAGAGGILFNLAMEKVMIEKSVAWALRAQAIICIVLTIFGISLVRTRSKVIKSEFSIFDRSIAKCIGFWIEVFWVILTMLGYVTLLYTLADFTRSLGYSSFQGSVVSALTSAGAFVGRPAIGILADKKGALNIGIMVHLLVAVFSFAMWIPARNYATALAFAFIQGSLMGSIFPISSPITAKIVGLRKIGVGFGMLWIFLGCSGLVSPVISVDLRKNVAAGQAYDPAQYFHVAIFVGCDYLGASLCLFFLRAWILARDSIAENIRSSNDEVVHADSGETLEIVVPLNVWVKHLFKISEIWTKV